MGRRKGRLEAAQLRFVARIHVCMFLFPCTGKCLSGVCHVADINGDATWLRVACLSNSPNCVGVDGVLFGKLSWKSECHTVYHLGSRSA